MKWDKDDRFWAELVKERDGWMCRRCLREFPEGHRRGLDAHHIFTKTRKSTRHMLLNGVALCTGHHINWAHREPLEFHEWIQRELGEAQYDELRRISQTPKKDLPPAVVVALPPKREARDEHIRELYAMGKTRRELAEMFDLTPQRIDQIVSYRR